MTFIDFYRYDKMKLKIIDYRIKIIDWNLSNTFVLKNKIKLIKFVKRNLSVNYLKCIKCIKMLKLF